MIVLVLSRLEEIYFLPSAVLLIVINLELVGKHSRFSQSRKPLQTAVNMPLTLPNVLVRRHCWWRIKPYCLSAGSMIFHGEEGNFKNHLNPFRWLAGLGKSNPFFFWGGCPWWCKHQTTCWKRKLGAGTVIILDVRPVNFQALLVVDIVQRH